MKIHEINTAITSHKTMENEQPENIKTYFASPERLPLEEIKKQVKTIINDPIVTIILESADSYVLILNEQRQVLAANPEMLEALHVEDPFCLIGSRPGEAFHCVYSSEGPGGCGTSKHCRTCGAVLSILASQENQTPATNECRLTVSKGGVRQSSEFHVRCSPVILGGYPLTVVVFRDISSLKRREILERVFFHDILNTLGGMRAWIEMLRKNKDPLSASQRLIHLSEQLYREIQGHRLLLQAEEGSLLINPEPVFANEILHSLQSTFEGHDVAKNRHLEMMLLSDEIEFTTDKGILIRILTNMTKNALEAISPGETVRVWFDRKDNNPGFIIGNPGVVPEETALHIFERSFSTKGEKGRGLGTYSMKLFGEKISWRCCGFHFYPGRRHPVFYLLAILIF